MRKIISFITLSLILFGCNGGNPSINRKKENLAKNNSWAQFESKEGRYKIIHPDYLVKVTNMVGFVKDLGEYEVHMNSINTQKEEDENLAYNFSHTTYTDAILASDKRSIRERYKELVSKKAEALKGNIDLLIFTDYKGIEICEAQISLKHQPIVLKFRILVVGQLEYELFVVMSENKVFNSSAEKFFNSFEITSITTNNSHS